MDVHMSNDDQISAFLMAIPTEGKNSKLVIDKDINKGDRSHFSILVINVIPHLSLSIKTKDHGAPIAADDAKHTTNASSNLRQSSEKCH
jgi:hypothetical protein